MKPDQCFIVMPFGVKPFPDGSGRSFDFDKVYRVVIQRAVREAGMTPIRADEHVGSALIHSDMFRDLRDRAVVLADLSLDNPNVFYELGIRHVMSSSGTVLMCRKGSVLPFDVKLSRTIFYDFDGQSLDWEEVERVLEPLKLSLEEARKGLPDSPVHALLPDSVLRQGDPAVAAAIHYVQSEASIIGAPLEEYQRLVAELWETRGAAEADLFGEHCDSIFGSRALAYLCLKTDPISETAIRVANHLNDVEQYRLANELYARQLEAGMLPRDGLLSYAASYSEAHPDITGADHAIKMVEDVMAKVEQQTPPASAEENITLIYAECHRRLAGLRQWRWELSREAPDLARAIAASADAIRFIDEARMKGELKHPGYLAQSRLKNMVLLRIRDHNLERPDVEGNRDAILALKPQPEDHPVGLSYLGWFQSITLADMGAGDESNNKALKTFATDMTLKEEYWEISRRQYVQLRRFLEFYAPYLRHPSLVGRISQVLQAET